MTCNCELGGYCSMVSDCYMDARLADMQEDLDALRAESDALHKLVWTRLYENRDADPEIYPCLLCGYNGQGFYQPDQHPCAALGEKP